MALEQIAESDGLHLSSEQIEHYRRTMVVVRLLLGDELFDHLAHMLRLTNNLPTRSKSAVQFALEIFQKGFTYLFRQLYKQDAKVTLKVYNELYEYYANELAETVNLTRFMDRELF